MSKHLYGQKVPSSLEREGCALIYGRSRVGHHKRISAVSAKKNFCPAVQADYRPAMPRKTAMYIQARQSDLENARLLPTKASRDSAGEVGASSEGGTTLLTVLGAVFWASMGALSFGYHLGVVNGPLDAISADLGFAGNAALQGLVVSSCLAGAAVGSLTGSGLADSLGRKKALLLASLPMLIGSLLSATASNLTMMVAGRLFVGVGIGLSSALVPLYISEVSPTKIRGTLGSLNQLVICIGILVALLANVVIDRLQWRLMFHLAAVPAALLALGMAISPESPRWLQSKGQTVAASASAVKLWGVSGPSQLEDAPAIGSMSAEPVSMGALLRCKGAIIGVMLFAAQQLSGINAVVYFSSATFASAGVDNGQFASALVGFINVAGTVVAALLIEKCGRKQLLSLSFTGMGLTMLAMSAGLGLAALAAYKGSIALVGTVLYVGSFALGAGAVPGLLVPEITPARLRGAVSLAMATHWIFNFSIGQLFLPAVTNFGLPSVYLFFACICALTVLYTRSQIVETRGLSLEEIEKQLAV